MASRRTFTLEFKREAVRLVTERKLSVPEAARQLGVGPNLLRKWRQSLAADGKQVSSEKNDRTALEEEVRRLRIENERLRMERDLLTRISQMSSRSSACDLRQTLENQVDSANSCPADRGTRWVTAKRAICGSISTAC